MRSLIFFGKGLLTVLMFVWLPIGAEAQGDDDPRLGGTLNLDWGSGSAEEPISKIYGAKFMLIKPLGKIDLWANIGFNIHPERRYTKHSLEINYELVEAVGYKKATTFDLSGGYKIGGVSDRKDANIYFSNGLDIRLGGMTIRNDASAGALDSLGISEERSELVGDVYFLGEGGFAFKLGLRSSIGIGGLFSRFAQGLEEPQRGQKEEIKLEEDFFLPFNYTGPRLRYFF
ncbi:MAG: hypothetical protein ABEH38_07610 [Flavobacteriales bacterium]